MYRGQFPAGAGLAALGNMRGPVRAAPGLCRGPAATLALHPTSDLPHDRIAS
jgi:hypothetical protein